MPCQLPQKNSGCRKTSNLRSGLYLAPRPNLYPPHRWHGTLCLSSYAQFVLGLATRFSPHPPACHTRDTPQITHRVAAYSSSDACGSEGLAAWLFPLPSTPGFEATLLFFWRNRLVPAMLLKLVHRLHATNPNAQKFLHVRHFPLGKQHAGGAA